MNMVVSDVPDVQRAVDYFAQGDVPLEAAAGLQPSVIFVMGQHLTRTLVTCARCIRQSFTNTPIILSGKRGRGTWLLDQAFIRHCLLHGRPLPTADDRRSEASLMKRLLIDEGIGRTLSHSGKRRFFLEEEAAHSEQNWLFSIPLFEEIGALDGGLILVVQADCNRKRAGETGRRILRGLGSKSQVLTVQPQRVLLQELGEADRAIAYYRTLGLKAVASELRVCEEFEPAVLSGMTPELRSVAQAAEDWWQCFLEGSPHFMDHFIGALLNTPGSVGGREAQSL
jgi:hypothetical protein